MRISYRSMAYIIVGVVFFLSLSFRCNSETDPLDVIVLQDIYKSLSSPPQLIGWKTEGGDPCGESWKGVSCSGSSVLFIQLPGLELKGSLGGQLFNLHNLKHLDVSFNNLLGELPFGLPPNASHINLSSNKFVQNLPYSLTSLKSLRHLNLSHNLLSGVVGNVFTGLQNLKEMDLSFNNFTGDLPSSFSSLTNLTRLFLQNNNFTGSVIYLSDLPLTDLNIQDNCFSGIIPEHFQTIPNLWFGGNRFHTEGSYPPWKFPLDDVPVQQNISSPPTAESNAIGNYLPPMVHRHKNKAMSAGGIASVVGGVALLTAFTAFFIANHITRARMNNVRGDGNNDDDSSVYSVPVNPNRGHTDNHSSSAPTESPLIMMVDSPPPIILPRHTPPARQITKGRTSRRRSFSRKCKMPVSAKLYSIGELQTATNSFCEENFLGEGSLGSVYRAEFPDGQMFAVKNISTISLSLQEEEQFLDVIRAASRLKHPNIIRLTGYCVEHGQHLILYEYVRNLTLDDALHCDYFMPLTWGLRLKIAVGIAQALEYMHSNSPPVAHCNLKAANVLLDDELLPRLCDCGLAILRPLTSNSVKEKASEMAISNSGYIAPEKGQPGVDATKADVYAFGVLLLELLTGRKPFDSSRPREEHSLVKWASNRLHDVSALEEMVDLGIKRSFNLKALSRFADIVSLCIQLEKEFRPPISEIREALAELLPMSGVGGQDGDSLDKSFRTTHTRFVSSPSMSV